MENNGFSSSDAVLWGAMNNMGRSGYGGGGYGGGGGAWGGGYGGGGGYGSHHTYADSGSIMHGIINNQQACENQADCTREVLGNSMDNNARAFESANIQRQFERVCDRVAGNEQRNGDRLRDLEREMNANARVAAQCCCDLAKQACEDKAQIIAEVKAAEGRGVERDRSLLQSELIALRTQVACGCTTGCSTPCDNGHHR